MPGEVVIPVPSLAVPDEPTDASLLANFSAVQLFVERAKAVRPDFELTPANAEAVAEIVRRLDGIPLALELAAARVKVLSPEQIASRLSDRFRILSGGPRTALPRQQTLRAAMDWSYRPAWTRWNNTCCGTCRCSWAAAPWRRSRRSAARTASRHWTSSTS